MTSVPIEIVIGGMSTALVGVATAFWTLTQQVIKVLKENAKTNGGLKASIDNLIMFLHAKHQ